MPRLSLGPLLYHWPEDRWRDFYFRIADEAPIDVVYLGEVVCPKRAPFTLPHYEAAMERLRAAGKEVVLSTPALVVDGRDRELLEGCLEMEAALVEANDITAIARLQVKERPFAVGPYVNVYNEGTRNWLAAAGAIRVTLPVELPAASIRAIAVDSAVPVEVQVFGRWPLAVSARCYHARAYGRTKDSCQYACGEDPDGLTVETLDGEAFLAVNGVQTQSYRYGALLAEMDALAEMGVDVMRLSPQDVDMVSVARLYRDVLAGEREAAAALAELRAVVPVDLSHGFFHGGAGVDGP